MPSNLPTYPSCSKRNVPTGEINGLSSQYRRNLVAHQTRFDETRSRKIKYLNESRSLLQFLLNNYCFSTNLSTHPSYSNQRNVPTAEIYGWTQCRRKLVARAVGSWSLMPSGLNGVCLLQSVRSCDPLALRSVRSGVSKSNKTMTHEISRAAA